jgi:5'-3' exonuclease
VEKNKLVLIDADGLLYYACYGKHILDSEGNSIRENGKLVLEEKTLEEVIQSVDSLITAILDNTNADCYIGFLTESKCFRYSIYPDYKANRKGLEKPKFINEARDHMKSKWGFISYDLLEADDAIIAHTKYYESQYMIIIASSDKDLRQIEGYFYNPKEMSNMELTYVSAGDASYNLWKSVIVGDSVDNIKGLFRCGEKFADSLLQEETIIPYEMRVFGAYLQKTVLADIAIQEFYKNYMCVKLRDTLFEGQEYSKVINYVKKEISADDIRGLEDW